ncbi:MAG: tripartite tricarboxylate transporter TctB family protein [Pseudomonadota bacterium]|nr:tripartite tricarboxylate transporter TctB family protein [Pseudomonadota bacterium]MBU2226191.1 tripartite tricarboxylate transporter TctB family protein [Pseudomonadota bacterium]MBU2261305.1 tripartite tricarboxylate transporter TctB family protein [Pseudomonadota bacterium]
MAKFNNDQVSGAIWIAVGIAVALGSLRYGLGPLESPGTGFLPFLAGCAIVLLALIGLIQSTLKRRKGTGWTPILQGVLWQKPLLVMAALFAYALLMKPLGFILCTVLFIGFLLRTVEPQRWSVVIVGAIGTALGAFAIFDVWLKAQLPQGPWGF